MPYGNRLLSTQRTAGTSFIYIFIQYQEGMRIREFIYVYILKTDKGTGQFHEIGP